MNEHLIGEVVSINPAKCRARIKFDDRDGIISEELAVVVKGSLKNKDYWMPRVGEAVLCSFAGKKGFILGAIYSDADPPPVSSEKKRYIEFEDGTAIEYDSATHTLTVECVGTINIKGNITVSEGDIVVDGISIKNHIHSAPGGNTSPPIGGG
ncbi:Phage baseplate assembly protein V [Desulfitobacterium hafniense]|uniref:Phage baseplate assembly protein V n=1 Tax=Desulfitobacterium hafniense TaxID=49338 RepID=A0A098AYV7_DESHA|nr:phage baseplate assembly protein V [Desulfitobacterium hafniense]CDX01305.1 Phage baseplate assembly protein V [Desulfitobacterium hafniense]